MHTYTHTFKHIHANIHICIHTHTCTLTYETLFTDLVSPFLCMFTSSSIPLTFPSFSHPYLLNHDCSKCFRFAPQDVGRRKGRQRREAILSCAKELLGKLAVKSKACAPPVQTPVQTHSDMSASLNREEQWGDSKQ